MKVLIPTPIFPPDIGGHSTAVPVLAGALAARGHQVRVLTLSDDPSTVGGEPYPLVRLPRRLGKPRRWPLTVATIVRYGRDADVLLAYGLGLEVAIANQILRKPLVFKVVGDLAWERARLFGWVGDDFDTFQRRRYGPRVEALRRLQSWWLGRADHVVTHSQYLAGYVQAWGIPRANLTVVSNAVDVPDPLVPAAFPLAARLKVVAIARLVPWKGLDRLIDVVGGIDGAGLVIVGDGPERARLLAHVDRLRLGNRVAMIGARNRSDTMAMMAAADLFVQNSSWEGVSHALLEAMALGLPVIATNAGASRDIVADGTNGYLIEPGDDAALRAALRKLESSPPERQRLAEGARRTATRFAPATLVNAMESVLARAASGHARGPAR